MTEHHLPQVKLFAEGVLTNPGILHEPGHKEPWIIAMDCRPTRVTVLDYGARRAIGPTFPDFESRGFKLEDSQPEHAERPERLIPIMSLAMYWCVRVGRDDARHHPTPLEKKLGRRPIPTIGASESSTVARYPGSNEGYVA